MKPMQAQVSVIITTRNRQHLLPRAIESALNQSFGDIELIVVDDGSNDDTGRMVREYRKMDSRVRYMRNEKPMGANASRNAGISAAGSKFIAGLDDDDEFLSNRLDLLLKNYDNRFSFITSNNIIDKGENKQRTNIPGEVRIDQMLGNNIIYNQGLIERSRIVSIGMYDTSLTACQDYDLWMRLILKYGPVKVISEETQIIHMDPYTQRISSKSRQKRSGYFNFYRKYKHLMSSWQRRQHLYRIYDIRSETEEINQLPRKCLLSQIDRLRPTELSIYGTGEFMEKLYVELVGRGIVINQFVQTFPETFFLLGKRVVTPEQAIDSGEQTFLVASVAYRDEMVEVLKRKSEEHHRFIRIVAV